MNQDILRIMQMLQQRIRDRGHAQAEVWSNHIPDREILWNQISILLLWVSTESWELMMRPRQR